MAPGTEAIKGVASPTSSFARLSPLRKKEQHEVENQSLDALISAPYISLLYKSLYAFSGQNRLRLGILRLVRNSIFENLVLLLIFTNCIFLALDEPPPSGSLPPLPPRAQYLNIAELVFTICFAVEALLKIVAFGFVLHPGSYLRNGWNDLDFFIVTMSFLALHPVIGNYSAVRSLRVLRPLRSINRLPGLKRIVKGLLYSMSGLFNVLGLAAFMFIIFGILGVQLWKGLLRYRCVDGDVVFEEDFCAVSIGWQEHSWWAGRGCFVGGPNTTCELYENPGFGYVGFDNFPLAFMTTFQVITLEGWSDIMYWVQDAWSVFAFIYFVLLVVAGAFIILNLLLAVISHNFTQEDTQEKLEARSLEKRLALQIVTALLKKMEGCTGAHMHTQLRIELKLRQSTLSGLAASPLRAQRPPVPNFSLQAEDTDIPGVVMMPVETPKAAELPSPSGLVNDIGWDKQSILEDDVFVINDSPRKPHAAKRACTSLKTGFSDLTSKLYLSLPISVQGAIEKITGFCAWLIATPAFNFTILGLIVLNTLSLALESWEQAQQLTDVLESVNLFLTFAFLAEMLIKLTGLGLEAYLVDRFNIMDGFIVIVSMLELAAGGGEGGFFSVFRALRLLRVFKMLSRFEALKSLISVTMSVIAANGYLNVIIMLFLFIAALVGMQFFGGQLYFPDEEETVPRANFDTFYNSIVTVFQILTRDDWVEVMWNTMRATSDVAVIYFFGLVCFGDFLLLNLFLAILIYGFEEHQNKLDATQLAVKKPAKRQSLSSSKRRLSSLQPHKGHKPKLLLDDEVPQSPNELGGSFLGLITSVRVTIIETNGGNSLLMFGPYNPFRLWCTRLIHDKKFDNFILACILLSSLVLAIENPNYDQDGILMTVLFYFNVVFTVIFSLELLFKIAALGLVFGQGAYLRSGWNILDGTIVLISVLSLVFADAGVSFFKVLRTFRALRPLRVISRNRGLKMVVSTLIRAAPQIFHTVTISVLIFMVFGILGVQIFKGKMYYCTCHELVPLPDGMDEGYCYGLDRIPCEAEGHNWTRHNQHFDHTIGSMLTLFEVSTLELWTSAILFPTMDTTEPGLAPAVNASSWAALYYICFIVVGAFFILNLFVGVVIFNFNKVKSEMDGGLFVTAEQKLWIEAQRIMLNFKPSPKILPGNTNLEKVVFALVHSTGFDVFIGICILGNVVVMALDHYEMSRGFEIGLVIADSFFSAIFLVEALLKIFALRLKYFWVKWNRFDFFLVCLSLVSAVVEMASTSGGGDLGILKVFRMFRILRIIRLIKSSKEIRVLLETLWYSLPSLANITAFLFLLFFIFAVLGVNLFGSIKPDGDYITHRANFQNFLVALLLLLRMATGENWNGIMHACFGDAPDCHTDACGSPYAPLYFVAFLLFAAFVMINLFIAIILDNFANTQQMEKSKVQMNDLHKFTELWSEFDPNATLIIPTHKVSKLLRALGTPLGLDRDFSRLELMLTLGPYEIPEHGGAIHFIETLIPLARKQMGVKLSRSQIRSQEVQWRQSFPSLANLPVLRYRNCRITVDQYFASCYIAAAFRRSKAREKYQAMRRQGVKKDSVRMTLDSLISADENSDPERAECRALESGRQQQAAASAAQDRVDAPTPGPTTIINDNRVIINHNYFYPTTATTGSADPPAGGPDPNRPRTS